MLIIFSLTNNNERRAGGLYNSLYLFFGLIYQCEKDKWSQFSTIVWASEAVGNFSKVWRYASRGSLILLVIQCPEPFAS